MTPAMMMTMMGGRCEVITYVDVPVFHVDRTVGGRRWTGGHGNKEIEEFDWFISVCFVISLCVSCVNYLRLFHIHIYIYIFCFSLFAVCFSTGRLFRVHRSRLSSHKRTRFSILVPSIWKSSRSRDLSSKLYLVSRVTFPSRNVLGPLGTDSNVTRPTIVVSIICDVISFSRSLRSCSSVLFFFNLS